MDLVQLAVVERLRLQLRHPGFRRDEAAGISVFRRDETGRVFLTYQSFSRGLDMLNGAYHWLDLTSKGRDEDDLGSTMEWLHRHDAYPD